VAAADTITDSGNGFITAGFTVGQQLIITGTASNNGVYTIGRRDGGHDHLESRGRADERGRGVVPAGASCRRTTVPANTGCRFA